MERVPWLPILAASPGTLEFCNKEIRGNQPGISQFIKLREENKLQEGRL